MASATKTGGTVRVTVTKSITRASALKTLTRLFMKDKTFARPIARRSANFIPLPRRRGGRIWTKYPNKVHAEIDKGATATILATAQHLRDLESVKTFVSLAR